MMTRSIALALSLTLAAAPAIAAPLTETSRSEVRTDDLDLTSARGQQRLEMRIKTAARRICNNGIGGVAGRAQQAECMADTLAAARPQTERAIAQAQGGQGGTQLALLMLRSIR